MENPADVDMFDSWAKFVIPLFAIKDDDLICIGSSVVILNARNYAIALSAVHVIEHGDSFSEYHEIADRSKVAPFLDKKGILDIFGPLPVNTDIPLKVPITSIIYEYQCFALLQGVSHFSGPDLDIAALTLQLPSHVPQKFPMRCAISSRGPQVGDEVYLCGYPAGNAGSLSDKSTFSGQLKIQAIVGKVIEVFGWGEHFLVRSPGFHIDVHAPSGFSGGGVFIENAEFGQVLCGVISSSDEYRATAAIIWPALPLENLTPHEADVPNTLLGLTAFNDAIKDLDKGWEHVVINDNIPHSSLSSHVMWKN